MAFVKLGDSTLAVFADALAGVAYASPETLLILGELGTSKFEDS